jgi:lipoprotein GNA1870
MQKKLVLSVLIASLLTACGGSSDNSNPQITPPPSNNNNTPQQPGNNQQQPNNPQNPQAEPVKSLTADYSTDNDYNWGDDYDGYDTFTLTVGGKTLVKEVRGEKKQTLDLTAVPLGFKTLTAENKYTGSNNAEYKSDVTLRSYRGFYAGALAYGKDSRANPLDDDYTPYYSPTVTLPNSGTAIYAGKVFNDREANDADLTYTINFGQKKGSGTVAAANGRPELTLQEKAITQFASPFGKTHGVDDGDVRNADGKITGSYNLYIAGPNAEEIVGDLNYGPSGNKHETEQVFYGKRGDITP